MKTKFFAVFFITILCFSLAACDDAKRPIDRPDTKWICESDGISFLVSEDGKITNAVMTDKNGEKIDISLVFSDMSEGKVSITNADGSEIYISGTCTYEKDKFTVTVTDIYNTNISVSSPMLIFNKK